MRRLTISALIGLAALAAASAGQAPTRYVIYLHGRIVEDEGRRRARRTREDDSPSPRH